MRDDRRSGDGLGAKTAVLRPLLTRWFARRAPSNEVDDLVQDVFLRIIKRGGTNELDHFQAYVFETASSVLKDRMRSRNVRHSDQHEEFDAERHAPSTPGAEELLISQQALELTSRILLELPERSRTIFILRRVEGLPIALIGRRLGLSVSAVEKHMQRATRHLLSRMEALR